MLTATTSSAQNYNFYAFDTNGPMGECLFPVDENGNELITRTAETNLSAGEIIGLSNDFVHLSVADYGIEANHVYAGSSLFLCEVEYPLMYKMIEVGWVGTFAHENHKLTFHLKVMPQVGNYTIQLDHLYSNRYNIHGDGKAEGPVNRLHWNRVNSLQKERGGKEQIPNEEAMYKVEYQTAATFVDRLIEYINKHQ